ncbi:MAG: hypothetical protein H3C47_13010 [Candidatus Cloacimonetes bacterium]|nr:hypothetical protein [Candidatus Cloacimonadota bacterium]
MKQQIRFVFCLILFLSTIFSEDKALLLQTQRIDRLHEMYFQSLFSQYTQIRDFYRHFISFLKESPDLGVVDFRIRTQQFYSMLGSSLENLSLTRKHLEELEQILGTRLKSVEQLSMQYMDTSLSPSLTIAAQTIKSQLLGYHFLLKEILKRQIDVLMELQINLNSLQKQALLIEEKVWQTSKNRIPLKSDADIIKQIRKTVSEAASRLQEVRNAFTYAEASLSAQSSKKAHLTPVGSKAMDPTRLKESKKAIAWETEQLKNSIESQALSLKVIQRLTAQASEGVPPDLHLPVLSAHLFFSHTNPDQKILKDQPKKEISSSAFESEPEKVEKTWEAPLPDWI